MRCIISITADIICKNLPLIFMIPFQVTKTEVIKTCILQSSREDKKSFGSAVHPTVPLVYLKYIKPNFKRKVAHKI